MQTNRPTNQRYAITNDQHTVINIVLAEQPLGSHWVQTNTAAIGDRHDPQTGTFTRPDPLPEPVPQTVSRAQGKAALIQAGLWPRVLDHIASLPEPDKSLADVALNDTQEWRRDSAFLAAIGATLELTTEQLDALFIAAVQIQF